MVTAVWRSIGQGVGKFGRRVSDPFREDMGLVLIRKGMSYLGGRCGGPSSAAVPWTWFLTWSVTAPLFLIAQECGHAGEGQNRLGAGGRRGRSWSKVDIALNLESWMEGSVLWTMNRHLTTSIGCMMAHICDCASISSTWSGLWAIVSGRVKAFLTAQHRFCMNDVLFYVFYVDFVAVWT